MIVGFEGRERKRASVAFGAQRPGTRVGARGNPPPSAIQLRTYRRLAGLARNLIVEIKLLSHKSKSSQNYSVFVFL